MGLAILFFFVFFLFSCFFWFHGSCNLGLWVSLLGLLVGNLYQRCVTDMLAGQMQMHKCCKFGLIGALWWWPVLLIFGSEMMANMFGTYSGDGPVGENGIAKLEQAEI